MNDDKCIIDPERDCIGKAAAAILEKRIADLEDGQRKESEFRELYYQERLERAKRDAKMDADIGSMNEKLDKLISWQEKQQNDTHEAQKSEISTNKKRKNDLIDKAIWLIVGSLITFVMTKIGLP